jgi:TonB-linked SusC/RagA family outer membrane protein
MRLKLLLGLFLLLIALPFQLRAQATRISLNLVDVPLNTVLNEIESKTNYTFLVNQQFVNLTRKVTAVYINTSVKEILEQLFKDEDIKIVVSDHQIILTPMKDNTDEQAKPGKLIKGKVTDSKSHEPLPGVTILVKGTAKGTITALDGTYSIDVPRADVILVFSYLGYTTQEIATALINQVLDVELVETSRNLEGVVVTALGIKREEKALGYSTQKVDGEVLQTVKVADPTTSLTGKVSGLMIKNSSNFGTAPVINLRGETPLIVVDGVPSSNISLNDLSQDDIKSIDVLKGATASALYGYRGANGVIMITTSRGEEKQGLVISVNTSTMFNLGFVVTPDRQTSYSSGYGGKYGDDYIWGDKLDIGRTTTLWDPYEMVWKDSVPLVSKGKDNLKNFQELGLVTNNNVSISSRGEHTTFRTSITHIFNKGQFPNQKLDKVIYTVGGEMNFNRLSIESNFSYSKHISPNIRGSQYSGGYLYNLIGWLGAEWDINEYKNYWMVKDEQQNWFNSEWYDNPYFLANEVIQTSDRDIMNGFVAATYKFTPWLKLTLRTGLDSYLNRFTYRNPISARNAYSYLGYYEDQKYTGYSVNNDLLLLFDKTVKDFRIDGMFGGTVFFSKDDYFDAYTKGGISIPGYYSLKASKDPIGWDTWLRKKQVNSLYSRASVSWKGLIYMDLTGRWDWSSTLAAQNNPYFYPSVAGSFVPSELMQNLNWLDLWKIRGSWTMSKTPADIYDINSTYVVDNEVWGGFNSAYFPTELKSADIRPQASQTYELGTAAVFLKNKVRFDLTLFRKRMYDFLSSAEFSEATGFYTKYVNTDEERTKNGIELVIGGTPVKKGSWKWDVNFNWSKDITTYSKIDEQYTPDEFWIKEGARVDAYTVKDWVRDPSGNFVNTNGFPSRSDYYSVLGYSNPDWIWGLNSSVNYKSFTFSFSVDGRVGGRSFSRLDALLWNSGAHIETDNQWRYDEVVNGLKNYVGPGVKVVSGTVTYDSYGNITSDTRVFEQNDVEVSYESYIKDHYQQGAWSWCSQNILDETFVKLREVSLTYVLPKSISEKIKLKDPSVSLVGQNLFYWGKEYKLADPDYGVTWDLVSPSVRYVGFNIKFNI